MSLEWTGCRCTLISNSSITYESGYPGVPLDFADVSLHDVVPMQSNQDHKNTQVFPAVDNDIYDTVDFARDAGVDPTRHNHRIDLERGGT